MVSFHIGHIFILVFFSWSFLLGKDSTENPKSLIVVTVIVLWFLLIFLGKSLIFLSLSISLCVSVKECFSARPIVDFLSCLGLYFICLLCLFIYQSSQFWEHIWNSAAKPIEFYFCLVQLCFGVWDSGFCRWVNLVTDMCFFFWETWSFGSRDAFWVRIADSGFGGVWCSCKNDELMVKRTSFLGILEIH